MDVLWWREKQRRVGVKADQVWGQILLDVSPGKSFSFELKENEWVLIKVADKFTLAVRAKKASIQYFFKNLENNTTQKIEITKLTDEKFDVGDFFIVLKFLSYNYAADGFSYKFRLETESKTKPFNGLKSEAIERFLFGDLDDLPDSHTK